VNSRSNKNLIESLRCAFAGIIVLWQSQRNIRIHIATALLILGLCWWLKPQTLEFLFLVTMLLLVLMTEAFNSVLETLTDILSPEYSQKAKQAKDMAAAAVLMTVAGAVAAYFIILGPRLYARLTS